MSIIRSRSVAQTDDRVLKAGSPRQKGAIMVKSENSKIRVLIYNSSDSAIIATLRDLYYSPIFPIIRFFRFFRLSSDYTFFSGSPIINNDYLHDSPIFPIIQFFDPIITTIYTILRFFLLYYSSDCSDCPPIMPILQRLSDFSDYTILPIVL